MKNADFETVYAARIKKAGDLVSKDEAKFLWDVISKWIASGAKEHTKNKLYSLLKDSEARWMNFPKFYRKRAIATIFVEELTENEIEAGRIQDYLSSYSIKDFYESIDYTKISFASLDDIRQYITEVGMTCREEQKEKFSKLNLKTRETSLRLPLYSYEFVLAICELLYDGLSVKEIARLRFDSGKFLTKKSEEGPEKKITFSKDINQALIFEIAMSENRYGVSGKAVPVYHKDGLVFGIVTEQIIRGILREFDGIKKDREVSPTSIRRTVTFCKHKNKETATEFNSAVKAEYDSWCRAFGY